MFGGTDKGKKSKAGGSEFSQFPSPLYLLREALAMEKVERANCLSFSS
jgi:hypothetical protein